MAEQVDAFTQGCGGKIRLLWAPCSAPEMRGCKWPWVCTSPTFATASLESRGLHPWCCPEASEPHQVCGQNQTQPVQKAALLPLFTYIKKATAVSVLHAVLEPWVSLLRSTASCYKTGFKLLFFSFPQSWPFLIYWNAGRSSDNHKNILFEATSPGFVAVKLDRQFCYSCAEF